MFEVQKKGEIDAGTLTNKHDVNVKCTYLTRDQDIGHATALVLHDIGPVIIVVDMGIIVNHGS